MSQALQPILIAEDDEILGRLALRQLAALGYTAQLTTSGKEAVQLASEQAFSLILMDVHMPLMDGLEAAKTIRQHEQDSHTGHVPILAITADLTANRQECLAAGFDDFVFRPVTTDRMRELLLFWLSPHGGDDTNVQNG